MIKGKDRTREYRTREYRLIIRKLTAVFLIVLMSVMMMGQAGFAAAEQAEDTEGYPVREVHRVKVGKVRYCAFVQRNAVLTPSEIKKMSDNELTKEILKRSGFYMKETNCMIDGREAITTRDWIKKGGSFKLNDRDLKRLREASPADGKPVKLHMDLRISPDPYVREKPEKGPETKPEDDPGTKPGDEPGTEPGDEPGDEPGTEPGDDPGTEPGDEPGTDPGDNPGTDPGDNPGAEPGTDPGDNPGAEQGDTSGTEPGDAPGTDPGDEPGIDPATDPEGKQDEDSPGKQPSTEEEGTKPGTKTAADSSKDSGDTSKTKDSGKKKDKRRTYSTFKLFSPELLFVVVATKADVKAMPAEDVCEPEKEPPEKPERGGKEKPEPGEMLPEYRTIPMTDRSGRPPGSTLEEGTPVQLSWVEPAQHSADGSGRLPLILGGLALAAAAAAAAVILARRRS